MSARHVVHALYAAAACFGIQLLAQNWNGPLAVDPARWWNMNGLSLIWSGWAVAAVWGYVFSRAVDPSFTAYQRLFEQTMHLVMASVIAWFAWMMDLASMPWWSFGLVVLVLGAGLGVLHYRRRSGTMACLFVGLSAGLAFGPISFVMTTAVLVVIAGATAATLEEWMSGNAPFET